MYEDHSKTSLTGKKTYSSIEANNTDAGFDLPSAKLSY
jgi:hypothetical protein